MTGFEPASRWGNSSPPRPPAPSAGTDSAGPFGPLRHIRCRAHQPDPGFAYRGHMPIRVIYTKPGDSSSTPTSEPVTGFEPAPSPITRRNGVPCYPLHNTGRPPSAKGGLAGSANRRRTGSPPAEPSVVHHPASVFLQTRAGELRTRGDPDPVGRGRLELPTSSLSGTRSDRTELPASGSTGNRSDCLRRTDAPRWAVTSASERFVRVSFSRTK